MHRYSLAALAWQSFREPTPEPLDDLRQTHTAALPYLAGAITRFLQEYPWITDGLSRSERRLLELAGGGSISLSAAFPRMHGDEDVYYITDLSIAALADTLSRTSPALLTLDPGHSADAETLQGAVTLTHAGRAVLARQQDRIALCGFDRWFGGVHMQTGANLWRWDEEHQRITRQ